MNIIYMALGAMAISLSPILTKAVNLAPTMIGLYRFSFGALSLGIILLATNSKIDKEVFKKSFPFYAAAGFFFSVDLWFWHRSIIYVGAGIATLLANSQTFYLVFIGRIFYKERPGAVFYPGMIFAMLGMGMVSLTQIELGTGDNNIFGIIFGLTTGLSYAIVTTSLKKASQINTQNNTLGIFIVTAVAAICSLVMVTFEGNFSIGSTQDLIYMFLYGGVVHTVGWLLITRSINAIPLGLTSLLLLLQPTLASVLGAFIYQEILTSFQKWGLILSLCGIYLASISKSKKQKVLN